MSEEHDFGWRRAIIYMLAGKEVDHALWTTPGCRIHMDSDGIIRFEDGTDVSPDNIEHDNRWQLYVEPVASKVLRCQEPNCTCQGEPTTVHPAASETPEVPPCDVWLCYYWDGERWTINGHPRDEPHAREVYDCLTREHVAHVHLFHLTDKPEGE